MDEMILKYSLTEEHMKKLLDKLDDYCRKSKSLTLSIKGIEALFWNPEDMCLESVGNTLISPYIKHWRIHDKRTIQIYKPFIANGVDSTIRITLADIMPDNNFDASIWITSFDILEFSMNYTHTVQLRTINPTSAWVTFYPAGEDDELRNYVDGSNTQIAFTSNVIDILALRDEDALPTLNRNNMWALFVTGHDITKMTEDIPNDKERMLLRRNFTTVVLFQTLLNSPNMDSDIIDAITRAIQTSDRRHFKISKTTFYKIMEITRPYLGFSDLAKFGFEIRRFDGKPWFSEKEPHESNKLHAMIRPDIFYRTSTC